MNEIPERIKKQMRKARHHQYLILFLLSVFLTAVGCGVKLFAVILEEKPNPVPFDCVTENSNYSEIYIQQISYPFASYIGNAAHQVYFALDTEVYPYVVCMSDNQFQAFEAILEYTYSAEDMEPPAPVPLYGMPVAYDEELKEQVLEYCDFFLGEGIIEEDNFKQWLGISYLDATLSPENMMSRVGGIIMILGGMCIVITSILLAYWFRCRRVTLALLSTPNFEQMAINADRQLDRASTLHYKKIGLSLTDDFIISGNGGFDMIRFDQIIDVKQGMRSAGLGATPYIGVTTRDGRVHQLAPINHMTAFWRTVYDELICLIKERMIVNEENQEDQAVETYYNPQLMEEGVKSNAFTGIIGAFLFSLAGVAIWIAVGKLGFIAGIAGFLIMRFAMRGYGAFGKTLDKKGMAISIFVTVIMIFAANWIGYCLDFYTSFKTSGGSHITFFTILIEMPKLMAEYEMWGGFSFDLIVGYGLSFWSCSSNMHSLRK